MTETSASFACATDLAFAARRSTSRINVLQSSSKKIYEDPEDSSKVGQSLLGIDSKIINSSLTPSLLKMRGIEATTKLAESPNSKVVVVGSGKDGLPLILGNN